MQFVGKSWLRAVIVLLPLPPPPAAGVVLVVVMLTGVGGWETGVAAVVMGLVGVAKVEVEEIMLEDMLIVEVGVTVLGEAVG